MATERPRLGPEITSGIKDEGKTAFIDIKYHPDREVEYLRQYLTTTEQFESAFAGSAKTAFKGGQYADAIIWSRKAMSLTHPSSLETNDLFQAFHNLKIVQEAMGKDFGPNFGIKPGTKSDLESLVSLSLDAIADNQEDVWQKTVEDLANAQDSWGAGLAARELSKYYLTAEQEDQSVKYAIEADKYLRKASDDLYADTIDSDVTLTAIKNQRAIGLCELAGIYEDKNKLNRGDVQPLMYLLVNLTEVGLPQGSDHKKDYLPLIKGLAEKIQHSSHRFTLQRGRARRLKVNLRGREEAKKALEGNGIVIGGTPWSVVSKSIDKMARHLQE